MTRDTTNALSSATLKTAILAIPLLALSACATMSPAERAAMQEEANKPVTCSAGADCEVKWGRALQWVLNNSEYKIQTQSSVMIATMGPLPNDPSPAFVITKTADGGSGYVIDFRAGCDNIFGCIPSLLASQASFVKAVMSD